MRSARVTFARRGSAHRQQPLFAVLALLITSVWCPMPAVAEAAEGTDATLFRVFLTDGTTLVSYGEYARVGDRVVFSMPLGGVTGQPTLHLVNIPASVVDWSRTLRYADSARYVRYATTRGEADFAMLSSEVARALNEIAVTTDSAKRLSIAEQARRTLNEWPQAHYGYRLADVGQIVGLLDEAIAELRAAAGERQFDLSFVATAEPPAAEPLLPDPTPAEAIEQAFVAARLTQAPAERVSLLRSIVTYVEDNGTLLAPPLRKGAHDYALAGVEVEMKIERAYASLSNTMLAAASAYASRADVRGVEDVIQKIRKRDEQLGQRRPDQVSSLIAAAEAQLDAARRLRLARDRWVLRLSAYRAYQGAVKKSLEQIARAAPGLEEIKALAGPPPSALGRLGVAIRQAVRQLSIVTPPAELEPPHALLTSAALLAESAVRIRQEATLSGNLNRAWDASAAAAGSLMLFARARTNLENSLKPPQLR